MTFLRSASALNPGPGISSAPSPELLLEGQPQFCTWPLLQGQISCGIWAASPGHHRVIREGDLTECFYILEGQVELYEEGSTASQVFGAGAVVTIEKGFRGSWKTLTAVKKIYLSTRC